ncbi:MAG: translation initiation factor IF-2 [Minicystis sp.]
MSKIRVYEIAKDLKMDQKALVALFQSMGIGEVRNHMSAVEADVVERLKRHLERQKTPEVHEERVRSDGRVVKRQRRAVEGEGIPAPRPSAPGAEPSSPRMAPPAPPSTAGTRTPAYADVPAPARSTPGVVPEAPSSSPVRRRAPAPPSSAGRAAPPPPAPSVRGVEAAPQPAAVVVEPSPPPPSPPAAVEAPPVVAAPAAPPAEPSRPAVEIAPAAVPAPPKSRGRASKAGAPAAAAPPVMEMFEPPPAAEPVAPPPAAAAAPAVPAAAPSRPAVAPPPPVVEETAPVIPAPPPAPKLAPVEPVAARPAPPAPEPVKRPAPPPPAAPPPPPAAAAAGASTAPRRPSSPPKTGIEYWGGRAGVPMPQPQMRTGTGTPQRRVTYDPRAASNTAQRPGASSYGPGARGPQGRGGPGGRGPQGGFQRGGKGPQAFQRKGPAQVSTQEMSSHKKVIKIEEQVTLQQLAAKMSVKATDVLMKLLSMGMTGVHINSTLDTETATILAGEFGWTVENVAVSEEDVLEKGTTTTEAEVDADLATRPPIVTVMGHVDHGKTSLLDRIRKASVAEGEAGGITQHIGAYRVETPRGTIAFLDTPGHEAFTEMRARGAKVTDIVILVVAADDGVMPQTREALSHAQAAKVPIVVAVNKIDKPGAEPEKIMRDLSNLGVQPEEWGGQTGFIQVSAKTGQGIDDLLGRVLDEAELLELKANPKKRASGTVIEALLDRGRGPVARVMVQDGTLRTGDILLAGAAWGKVRAMTDELGRAVGEAGPATPVEVLGLNEVPSAGDPVHAVKDARTAEEIAETRRKKQVKTQARPDAGISIEKLVDQLKEAEQFELKLIIKGDVQGSVEAVNHALAKLSTQKVKVTIVHAAVGGITEGDVNLAIASKAIIVGFNVRPAGKAASHAESEGIEIRLYNIIYNAVDDIRSAMEGLLPATKVEKVLGKAEVRQIFRIAKVGLVCGCMVLSGSVKRTADARLIRDSVVVWTGKLSGLRRFKDDVREVAEGFECGISIDGYQDIKEGDIVESFENRRDQDEAQLRSPLTRASSPARRERRRPRPRPLSPAADIPPQPSPPRLPARHLRMGGGVLRRDR